VFMGKRGNNPYCHHRAIELAKRGLRERLVRKMAAPGVPFDHGVFDLIEEPLDAPLPEGTPEWLGMDAKAGMVPLPILSGLPEET